MIYFAISLLPVVWKRQRTWEAKLKEKGVKVHSPTWLQRLTFIPLCSLLSLSAWAQAFHRDFEEMAGLKPGTACLLMIAFPALYFLIGFIENRFEKKE